MTHKQKVKLARKMRTPEEASTYEEIGLDVTGKMTGRRRKMRTPLFKSAEWLARKEARLRREKLKQVAR